MLRDTKDPAEIITVGLDFAALTASPSTPVVTVERDSGPADADPQAILSGGPQVSGSLVLQRVVGGVAGCNYRIRVQVNAPDSSRYVEVLMLLVRAAG
ncbi:MAG: hypothetical protein RLY71_434 [Pseudomonadota bacterium]|jgi:hypothetical protein